MKRPFTGQGPKVQGPLQHMPILVTPTPAMEVSIDVTIHI